MSSQLSKEQLERLRNIPIVNLLRRETRQIGQLITSTCPFHNPEDRKENSPSFFIYPDNSYHCFSCGTHGHGAISFVIARDKVGFMEAVKALEPGTEYDIEEDRQSPEEYLIAKGINDEATKEKYGIVLTTHKSYPAIQFDIPTGVKYRLFGGQQKYMHSPGASACIFKSADNEGDVCYVGEGEFDAIVLNEHYGIPAWSSTTGSASTSVFQANLHQFEHFQKIYILYDSDSAGKSGAKTVAQILGIERCFIVECPAKDWSDYFSLGYTKVDFGKLVMEAISYSEYSRKESERPGKAVPKQQEPSRQSKTKKIIQLALKAGLKTYLSEAGKALVVLPEHPIIAYQSDSREFENWLRGLIYRELEDSIADNTIKLITGTIIGHAMNNGSGSIKTYLRTGFIDNQLFYDLGDGKRLVVIDDKGWRIEDFTGKQSPLYFLRSPLSKPQYTPSENGDIKEVLNLINVHDQKSKIIYLTTLVSWLFPHIPRPILLAIGPKGSAKSTSLANIKMLIDPSRTPLIKAPKDLHELAIYAAHQSVLTLDNMSKISDEFSDFVAMQVTGGGFISRELYSNDQLMVFDRRPAFGITSIISVVNKPDLLSRSITVEHHEITEENRREESEMQQAFEDSAPRILGGMFTVASKVIQLLPSIKLKKPPRMSDYAKFSAAAWVAMGGTLEEYEQITQQNFNDQNETALENSTVGQAILSLFEGYEIGQEKEYSPTQLFEALRFIANPGGVKFVSGFPVSANKLKSYIVPIIENLREAGIQITSGRTGTSRWWKIKKLG